jgi:hypothetical protein
MESKRDILSIIEKSREIEIPNLYSDINNSKGIKRFLKKVIYKFVAWLFHPLLDYLKTKDIAYVHILHNLNQYAVDLEEEVVIHKDNIERLTAELKETKSDLKKTEYELRDIFEREQRENKRKLGSIARDTIRTKWRFMDYILSLTDESEREIQCGICEYKNEVKTFKTLETDCIFEGGHLVRYICPECGVIFGPVKFSDRTEQEFDDDYVVHYCGYSEGGTTDKEVATFMLLKPEKERIYLNYGCGSWSDAMQILSDKGYTVYGYEPYSYDIGNPKIITSKETLSKMRFDGIFTHDVLEHLPDPISDLKYMKSLLISPDAKMAHTTGCYEYAAEFTRFHMYFFTGKSLDVICEHSGLTHGELIRNESLDLSYYRFMCYLYAMIEDKVIVNYMPFMTYFGNVESTDDRLIVKPQGTMHGPYVPLSKGRYKLNIDINIPDKIKNNILSITADSSNTKVNEFALKDGENYLDFELSCIHENIEFILSNNTEGEEIIITAVRLFKE